MSQRVLLGTALAVIPFCFASRPCLGQPSSTVKGVILDSATRAPVSGADVWVRSQRTAAVTDSLGRFAIFGLPPGFVTLQVRHLGYKAVEDTITLRPGDETVREVWLVRQPVLLDTLRTTAEGQKYVSPGLRGFEERRKRGFGRFIADTALRQFDHTSLASVLGKLPGVRLVSYRASAFLASTRGRSQLRQLSRANPYDPRSPRACWVAVYQDGTPLYLGIPDTEPPDFQRLNVMQYAGVEYYPGGATTPMQYAGIKGSDCGVLLLWTRER